MIKKENEYDIDAQLNKIMMVVSVIMSISMMFLFIVSGYYQQKYLSGQMTKEEWGDIYKIIAGIMIGNIIFPLIYIGLAMLSLKIKRLEFQTDQALLDTLLAIIYFTPRKTNCYQIQTPTQPSNEILVTHRMFASLQKTTAFNTLKSAIETKGGIPELDQTKLFSIMAEDIKEMKKDPQLIKDVKELLKRVIKEADAFDDKNLEPKITPNFADDFDVDISLMGETDLDVLETKMNKLKVPPKPSKGLIERTTSEITSLLSKHSQYRERQPKQEISNEFKKIRDTHTDPLKNVTMNYDALIKIALVEEQHDTQWRLGYRKVKRIVAVDEIDEDYTYYDEILKEERYKDPFMHIDSMFYIIPEKEEDFFHFHDKMSSDGNYIPVRKTYVHMVFVCWLIEYRVPLVLCLHSTANHKLYNMKLSTNTFEDSTLIALTQLAFMAYNEDEALRDKVANLEAKEIAWQTERDVIKQQKIAEFIDEFNLTSEIRNRIAMKPLNATSVIFGILAFLVGIGLGKVI